LRASIRGIDLILEEGMNVKVCTFPDGEDPDSFAKTSYEDLVLYLENNAKDFIQFKASLLMNEAKNDPIKKADLIRDMVVSISKIRIVFNAKFTFRMFPDHGYFRASAREYFSNDSER
jgi:DNA primase